MCMRITAKSLGRTGWFSRICNHIHEHEHLQVNTSGKSYAHVYLEILVPDMSTYSQYVITFEIT